MEDATGEIGPFKQYKAGDNETRYHSGWYGDQALFIESVYPWFSRGGRYIYGVLGISFCFVIYTGETDADGTFRIVLAL